MLQSSPLTEKIFSRNFSTVASDLIYLLLGAGTTDRPLAWPVTATLSNLDPAEPIFD